MCCTSVAGDCSSSSHIIIMDSLEILIIVLCSNGLLIAALLHLGILVIPSKKAVENMNVCTRASQPAPGGDNLGAMMQDLGTILQEEEVLQMPPTGVHHAWRGEWHCDVMR